MFHQQRQHAWCVSVLSAASVANEIKLRQPPRAPENCAWRAAKLAPAWTGVLGIARSRQITLKKTESMWHLITVLGRPLLLDNLIAKASIRSVHLRPEMMLAW